MATYQCHYKEKNNNTKFASEKKSRISSISLLAKTCESCFPFHLKKIYSWTSHIFFASGWLSSSSFTIPAYFTSHAKFLFLLKPLCMWTDCLHKCRWFSRKLTWNSEQMRFKLWIAHRKSVRLKRSRLETWDQVVLYFHR